MSAARIRILIIASLGTPGVIGNHGVLRNTCGRLLPLAGFSSGSD